MGSSKKKKQEKKKDFQKTKLKVGKTKPKASNFTDTSFKSKSIVLTQQSLSTTAPSVSQQFSHHLSLLTSKNTAQVHDALAHIASHIASSGLPVEASTLLDKLLPLIYHTSSSVRTQLLKVFRALAPANFKPHISRFFLHIRAGMTKLAPEIRHDTVEVLAWLVEAAGLELVSGPGGWVKILKCFTLLFRWEAEASEEKWTKSLMVGKGAGEDKGLPRQLFVFGRFLSAGLEPPASSAPRRLTFPLWEPGRHMLPTRPNCFAYLSLFGPPPDEDSQMMLSPEDRWTAFRPYRTVVNQGLQSGRRSGGETGRMAATVVRVLEDATSRFGE